MKTFYVLFVNEPVTDPEVIKASKRYTFNSKDGLKVGDIIESSTYKKKLQVVEELPGTYEYFNFVTGMLKNKITDPKDAAIKELVIGEAPEIPSPLSAYGLIVTNVASEF